MKPDEFFGSCADGDTPRPATCITTACDNAPAPGYLMCLDCRDRLGLKTEPPKPVVPRQYTRWTPQLDNTIRDNAHLGKNVVASILGCNVASVTTRASHLGVSLKIRELAAFDEAVDAEIDRRQEDEL